MVGVAPPALMELCLVSASSRSGSPPGCDVTFSVPNLIQSLPVWQLWDKEITPFRDRTMIEKITSIPEIQEDLKRIIAAIDEELHKRVPSEECEGDGTSICSIGITCREGTRVSPCYVEKLYEEYSHRPPIRELLVKRDHLRISPCKAREPSEGKLFIWQRSIVPINYRKFEDLTVDRLWTTFPFHMASAIEDGFKKDPFSQKFQLVQDFFSYTFNFETGEMYDFRKNKTFRFRCTVSVIEDRITSKILGDVSYKPYSKRYDAAGILFYSIHPVTAEPVFLLGHMTYSTECWCDFGGLRNFRERPRYTAARECAEETLGVLGEVGQLFKMLGNYKANNVFKVINEGTSYISHFMRVPYGDYPRNFSRAVDEEVSVEIDEMRWFSLSSLRGVAKTFAMQVSNISHPTCEDGSVDKTCWCKLRYEFLQTMCIAERLGFLCHIQHICEQHHAKTSRHNSRSDSGTNLCGTSEVRTGTKQGSEPCCGLEGRANSLSLQVQSPGVDQAGSSSLVGTPSSAGGDLKGAAELATGEEGGREDGVVKGNEDEVGITGEEGGGGEGAVKGNKVEGTTGEEGGGEDEMVKGNEGTTWEEEGGREGVVKGATGGEEVGGVTGKGKGVKARTKNQHGHVLYFGMGAGNFRLLH